MTPPGTGIRALLDRRSEAIRAQDLDSLTACDAVDIDLSPET